MYRYCISDVHGCLRTLQALLKQLNLQEDDVVYFLGDYVDRGLDSKGVLELVSKLPQAICLKGNHEQMMQDALRSGGVSMYGRGYGLWENWLDNGGRQTLASFSSTKEAEGWLDWIDTLPLSIELEDYFLVHAGINSLDYLQSTDDDLLWDRSCKVNKETINRKVLICGHTVRDFTEIEGSRSNYKIGIDNGCVFYKPYSYEIGRLLALRLEDMEIFHQINIDQIERD